LHKNFVITDVTKCCRCATAQIELHSLAHTVAQIVVFYSCIFVLSHTNMASQRSPAVNGGSSATSPGHPFTCKFGGMTMSSPYTVLASMMQSSSLNNACQFSKCCQFSRDPPVADCVSPEDPCLCLPCVTLFTIHC
jgi:hypothetical protein